MGRVTRHLAIGEYEEAGRIGELRPSLAYESGYAIRGIHRLLPMVGDGSIIQGELDETRRISAGIRSDPECTGHELGMPWADAANALLTWLDGDATAEAEMLRYAMDRLEALP